MKDSEFLELLNLYLDHEISPADAARLEAEVRASPDRRRTYLQYCRMQKACAALAAEFAADRPAPVRESAMQRLGWAAAGFASFGVVAAGLAVAFVLWQSPPASGPAASPALAAGATLATGSRGGLVAAADKPATPRLSLVNEPLMLSAGLQARSFREADQLEWLRNFQMAAVPVADGTANLLFSPPASPRRPEIHPLGLKAQAEAAEMTAFRYSK